MLSHKCPLSFHRDANATRIDIYTGMSGKDAKITLILCYFMQFTLFSICCQKKGLSYGAVICFVFWMMALEWTLVSSPHPRINFSISFHLLFLCV